MTREEYEEIQRQISELRDKSWKLQARCEAAKAELVLPLLDKLHWEYRRSYSRDLFLTELPDEARKVLNAIGDGFRASVNLPNGMRFTESSDREYYLGFDKWQQLIAFLERRPDLRRELLAALQDACDKAIAERDAAAKTVRELRARIKKIGS